MVQQDGAEKSESQNRSSDTSDRKNTPGNKTATLIVFAVLALVGGLGLFKEQFLDAQQALDKGVVGSFTPQRCEHHGGSAKQRPETVCQGDFRGDEAAVVLDDVVWGEVQDATGIRPGDSFRARVLVSDSGDPLVAVPTALVSVISSRGASAGLDSLPLACACWVSPPGIGCHTARRAPGSVSLCG